MLAEGDIIRVMSEAVEKLKEDLAAERKELVAERKARSQLEEDLRKAKVQAEGFKKKHEEALAAQTVLQEKLAAATTSLRNMVQTDFKEKLAAAEKPREGLPVRLA